MPLLIGFCGVFVIAAAIGDWEWFFTHPRAALFVDLLGRDGARVLYAVMGVVFLWLAYGVNCRLV